MDEANSTAAAEPKQTYTYALDQSVILSAIDNCVTELKSAWQKKNPGNPSKEAFYFNCMDETAQSIKDQMIRIAEPIDAVVLEQQLNAFKSRYLVLDEEEDESTSESEQEQDLSFDDDEVLDAEAYDKVRDLRAKTREIAARVFSTREEAIGGALGVTGRSVQDLLEMHGFGEGQVEGESEQSTEDAGDRIKADSGRINPLNAALRNLTSSLENVDSGLTERIESIKETISTIDSAVDKYQRVSQGDENVLSQTEKALIAASNVKTREIMEEVGEETLNDPDRNLARLLSGA